MVSFHPLLLALLACMATVVPLVLWCKWPLEHRAPALLWCVQRYLPWFGLLPLTFSPFTTFTFTLALVAFVKVASIWRAAMRVASSLRVVLLHLILWWWWVLILLRLLWKSTLLRVGALLRVLSRLWRLALLHLLLSLLLLVVRLLVRVHLAAPVLAPPSSVGLPLLLWLPMWLRLLRLRLRRPLLWGLLGLGLGLVRQPPPRLNPALGFNPHPG